MSAFILKSSKNIISSLNKLGFEEIYPFETGDCIGITNDKKWFRIPKECLLDTDPRTTWGEPYRTNCDTNEDLFLNFAKNIC